MKATAERQSHHNTPQARATTMRLRFASRVLPLAMALVAALSAVPAVAGLPDVVGVRTGVNGEATRFVLELSDEVAFDVFTLDGPDRVVIDLPALRWGPLAGNPRLGAGLISGVRHGVFGEGRSRIVLDVAAPAEVRAVFLLAPDASHAYRLVLDVAPRQAARPVQAGEGASSPGPRCRRRRCRRPSPSTGASSCSIRAMAAPIRARWARPAPMRSASF